MSIPTSPRIGAVTDTAAVVKVNIEGPASSALRLVVARDEDLTQDRRELRPSSNLVQSGYPAIIVTFTLDDLQPGTAYHCAIAVKGQIEEGARGRFKTLPQAGSRAGFRFAAASCDKFKRPEAFQAITREHDLLFFVYHGDLYYDIDETVGHERLQKYDRVLRRPEVGQLWSSLPVAYTWDDHDFLGNGSAGGDPRLGDAPEVARAAYRTYFPHYEIAVEHTIAQKLVVGNVVILLTDTRSQRSRIGGQDGPAKTMLGRLQREWLKQELSAASDRDLIIWINSVPWISKRSSNKDHWGGYDHERRALASFVEANDIRNLCMVSGDAHMLAFDDGSNSLGGFPVYHNASLGSRGSKKGGPEYSGGSPIKGRRQYGVLTLRYEAGDPVLEWEGKKAKKRGGQYHGETLIRHRFRPR